MPPKKPHKSCPVNGTVTGVLLTLAMEIVYRKFYPIATLLIERLAATS
ncbi:MAG: hypothetical protein ACI90V_009030 [Bacillariaceae sp.]|jgi:hypothetical protein